MKLISPLLNILWGPWTPVVIISVAVYFTIRTRFVQIRKIKEMFSLIFNNTAKTEEGIPGIQSFMLSVAGRVGGGNIAGIAGAICYGGPGSIIWMCLAAIVGAASSFIECTLAQIYKTRFGNKEFRGGATFYIEKGLGLPKLALLFSIFAYFSQGFGFHLTNMASIVSSTKTSLGIDPLVTTIITAVLFSIIIIGGVRRIGGFVNKAVPFMAIVYFIMCAIIIVMNFDKLPATIALMINSAFNPDAFLGGMIGTAITWGVKRGLYSNEAGLGSAAYAAGSSDVQHPVIEGLTQSLAVYVDTLFICLIGAVTIMVTDSFNVIDQSGKMIIANIPEVESGILYIQTAISSTVGNIGSYIFVICVWFFCFTSLIAMHYYAEVNISQILKKNPKGASIIAKVVSITAIFFGGLTYSDLAWAIGDVSLGLMAVINIPVILFLGKYALIALKDYESQTKDGVSVLTFDPEALGITGTEPGLWKSISEKNLKEYKNVS